MALYYDSMGNDKYKLRYISGSRENRVTRTKTVQITGSKKQVEIAIQRELLKFEEQVENELKYDSQFDYDHKTFKELSEKWIELKAPEITPRTVSGYKAILKNRLGPEFNRIKVKDITPIMIKGFYSKLLTTNSKSNGKGSISPNTVNKIHNVLSGMFSNAYQYSMISDNVMTRVTPPKEVKHTACFYNQEDIDAMLKVLYEEDLQFICMILTAISTGGRRGELCALKWSDIDFSSNRITIQRAVSLLQSEDGPGERVLKPSKTFSRGITVPKELIDLMQELYVSEGKKKMQLGEYYEGEDKLIENFIFTNEFGYWYRSDWITKRWAKFIKKNKLKKITFHELRHTSASIFISSGIDVKNVQRILGHTRADTTLNIYSHIFDSNNDEAAQAIESKLFKNVHPNVHPTSKIDENK